MAVKLAPETAGSDRGVEAPPRVQIRCDQCFHRLGDALNEITGGDVTLSLKCPRCKVLTRVRIVAYSPLVR